MKYFIPPILVFTPVLDPDPYQSAVAVVVTSVILLNVFLGIRDYFNRID